LLDRIAILEESRAIRHRKVREDTPPLDALDSRESMADSMFEPRDHVRAKASAAKGMPPLIR
jgi:hypothetical protein